MKYILFLLLLLPSFVNAQQRYIIFFADKGVSTSFNEPAEIIGRTAAAKRVLSGIGTDYYDLPVAPSYRQLLSEADVRILRASKWLNALLVETSLSQNELKNISDKIERVMPAGNGKAIESQPKFDKELQGGAAKGTNFDYGVASAQNNLLGIKCLHDRGFTGKGVTVAFLDCGYPGLDTISYFDSLITNNRVKGTYDFWGNTSNVYYKNNHGTNCASAVLAQQDGLFVGTAPDANSLFAITDDYSTETPQDEFNYAAALEWADSLGADIISASISYKTFDDPQDNYIYSDMDGKTAITTRACRIAAAKGLLIVNAGGNGGRICAPCDADSILCVGGATGQKSYDGISSYGPSFDGRVKPDVAAKTIGVQTIDENGQPRFHGYGGTSTATPQVAGLAICLKQKHPTASVIQLVKAIRQSAHRANTPDSLIGYGVPDACKADSLLSVALTIKPIAANVSALKVYPNPASSVLYFHSTEMLHSVQIISMTGQVVKQQTANAKSGAVVVEALPGGNYLLQVLYNDGRTEAAVFSRQ